jgi:hypothetical protein
MAVLGEKKVVQQWGMSGIPPKCQIFNMMITLKYLKTNSDYCTKGCVRRHEVA